MKIYRITQDVNKYRTFLPEDEEVWSTDRLLFQGRSKIEHWSPPNLYCFDPLKPEGDFVYICPGCIVMTPKATEQLRDILEMAGELLPVSCEGRTYTLLNVTECANCIDQNRTHWNISKTSGQRIGIEKYAFHANRLPESSLFKIPETCKIDVLTVMGVKDKEDEFKYAVESRKLKGLIFEELWSSS